MSRHKRERHPVKVMSLKPKDLENLYNLELRGEAEQLVAEARQRLAHMDEVDGGEYHLPPDMRLRTVLMALNAALCGRDWTCAADAYCMLMDVELAVRKAVWGRS